MYDSAATWDPASVRSVLDLIDGRWVLQVLQTLSAGPLRRNALRKRLGSIADKVLTETLRRMERQNLVSRRAVPTVPVEVDYALTPFAVRLCGLLSAIDAWQQQQQQQTADCPDRTTARAEPRD